MQNDRAIPTGYMRVGELAKKAGVTVRTLQYYDKEGLLCPSAASEGGFRLYSDKDMVMLMRILMMKQLGFGLAEIKACLPAMDTPADVAHVLADQAEELRRKIAQLTQSLGEIEALKDEVVQMETVNFKKYAAILHQLQMGNHHYWMIKYFDDAAIEEIRQSVGIDNAMRLSQAVSRSHAEVAAMQACGIPPESEQGLALAQSFWETMLALSGGDISLIERLNEQVTAIIGRDAKWDASFSQAQAFIQQALTYYFNQLYENQEGTT